MRVPSTFLLPSTKLKAALGGLAGSLLSVKTVVDPASIGELFVLFVFGAELALPSGPIPVLLVTELALLFAVLYVFVPTALRRGYAPLHRSRSFVLFVAGLATVHAAIFLSVRGGGPFDPRVTTLALAAFFGSMPVFWAYFRFTPSDWRAFASAFYDQLAARTPEQEADELSTAFEFHATLSAAATVAALFCLVLGVLGAGLLLLSPALEAFVVAWVAASVVVPAITAREWPTQKRRLPAIERRLFGVVEHLGSTKGNYTLLLVAVGVFASVRPVIEALAAIPFYLETTYPHAAPASVAPWIALGHLASLLVVGGYGIWYWLRVVERLPGFLGAWEGRPPGDDGGDRVARPPGLFVPLLAVFVPLGAHLRGGVGAIPPLSDPAYALAWPAGIAIVAWATLRTRRTDPQDVWTEAYAIPAALVVQLGGTFVALPFPFHNGFLFVLVVLFCLWLFYEPSLTRRVGRPTTGRRLALHAGYHAGATGAFATLSLVAPAPLSTAFVLLAALPVAVGIGVAVFEYGYDSRFG